MAGAKFQYDESGSTFYYFLLSFEALVVIPCTYYFYPRNNNKSKVSLDKSLCHCENCGIKNSRLRLEEPWCKAKQRLTKFGLFIGWIIVIGTMYKVAHVQHDYIAYDPFEILQIDSEASTAEIKKAYRKLSLIYHPDKDTGDEKKFMMLAKAYAALTDDEARKNWQTFGNPDGPGATSFGIALPSWIIEKENSVWVLGLYALVFMVALPVTVGVWWYRSVKFGMDKVLLDTTQLYLFFLYKTPHMIFKRIIMVIAASMEFRRQYNSEIIERPSDNVEVIQLIKELSNVGERNREKPLCFPYSIKARALLHAHLSRIKLPPNTLEEDRLYIVKKCPYLIQDFVQCASQLTMLALSRKITRMPNLDTLEYAMKLSACIVQSMWPNMNPLLQLPHISEDMLRHFTSRKRNVRSIRSLASMKSDDRRAMLRSLSTDEYDDIMNVISKMPVVDIEVKSEVLDDEDSCSITAGAIVTVTATLNRRNMSTLLDQGIQEEVAEVGDEQPIIANGDMSQTKKKVWEKSKFSKSKKKKTGGKMKKKAAAKSSAAPAVKKADVKNGIIPNIKPNVKESEDSDSETNIDSDSASRISLSDAEDQDDVSTIKSEKEVEEDDMEWEKFQQKLTKKEKVLETKSKKSHAVHCPFFPDVKQEHWWIYLTDKKKHALITAPYLVTNLVTNEEVELKFTAPSRPGVYTYCVNVRCDSYIDFDVTKVMKLDVKEAKEVDLTKLQWDVSEEEEEKDEEESAVEDSDLASDDELEDE